MFRQRKRPQLQRSIETRLKIESEIEKLREAKTRVYAISLQELVMAYNYAGGKQGAMFTAFGMLDFKDWRTCELIERRFKEESEKNIGLFIYRGEARYSGYK